MPLTIHHLHSSQSERIPWLCEELNIPYELKTYKRDPIFAPPEYKALHPSGAAPVIQDTLPTNDGGSDAEPQTLILAESCACVEYISHKYGNGRLFLPSTHKDYATFLYWFHWANGTFQPLLGRLLTVETIMSSIGGGGGGNSNSRSETQNQTLGSNPLIALWSGRRQRALRMLDNRFKKRDEGGEEATWLAGEEFTAADIIVVFSLTTFRNWYRYSLQEYKGILGYLQRIGGREGYRRAMAQVDPEMTLALDAEPPVKM
ncbi:uncharacterized protein PADG_00697 [Paracoccidioides brasiliensis Pb18]|uniref:Glutathione S-transferase n=1 Tax=Paracoccidioides brasiliensis (strain Pb18) TaxID=502780 RepID=C1G1F7_PARBD|nr:uncharacterized protein PADG_00697 [Paracoccidioides brasiliensis Pb18]EEH44408.1 hypothetical protein PADG_00697 [Paracoccidioides brasiliensis Pb18]